MGSTERIYIFICKNIDMYATTIFKGKETLNFRVGLDIAGFTGRVPGRCWRKKGNGENDIITF